MSTPDSSTPPFKVNKDDKVWDWRDWRPHPPNKGDDLMMDNEMMTRLGKIGFGMVRKDERDWKIKFFL